MIPANDEDTALPSRYQLGANVLAHGRRGRITGVCFRAGSVSYEVNGLFHDSSEVLPLPFRWQVSAETLAREQAQRARLEARLAGRKRKPMDYDDIGIPHLRED